MGMEELDLHHRCRRSFNIQDVRIATISVRMVLMLASLACLLSFSDFVVFFCYPCQCCLFEPKLCTQKGHNYYSQFSYFRALIRITVTVTVIIFPGINSQTSTGPLQLCIVCLALCFLTKKGVRTQTN